MTYEHTGEAINKVQIMTIFISLLNFLVSFCKSVPQILVLICPFPHKHSSTTLRCKFVFSRLINKWDLMVKKIKKERKKKNGLTHKEGNQMNRH